MNQLRKGSGWVLLAAALAGVALLAGCEISGSDETVRNLPIDFSGYYYNNSGSNSLLVSNNSGAAIKTMTLRQAGDKLEAVDNNGSLLKGTIGNVLGNNASFTLSGKTTAGADGTLSGNLLHSGESQATMSGTWIEPGIYGQVYGIATIAPPQTNTPINTNTGSLVITRADWRQLQLTPRPSWLWFMNRVSGFFS